MQSQFNINDPTTWNDYGLLKAGQFWQPFDSYDDLKKEVLYQGLPEFLVQFDTKDFDSKKNYIKNKYQNWSVIAYAPLS